MPPGALLLSARGLVPEYTIENDVIRLKNVGPGNPIIYDKDWWTDVPDVACLWAKASLGEANLKGNIITRCTFGWETKYAHTLRQQTDEAEKLLHLAKDSGLKNIPEPVIGSAVAIRKPASGKAEETQFERSAGSALIIEEAKKATVDKPLLVFAGGSCTTIASTWLWSSLAVADTGKQSRNERHEAHTARESSAAGKRIALTSTFKWPVVS